jgi:hypothetical protein
MAASEVGGGVRGEGRHRRLIGLEDGRVVAPARLITGQLSKEQTMDKPSPLGFGLGLRPSMLERIRADYPIVMHGVSMSIASTVPLDVEYLKALKELADRFQPEWISDHLCWTGVHGANLHDLLPIPYTSEALDHIVERITLLAFQNNDEGVTQRVAGFLWQWFADELVTRLSIPN